MRSSTRPNSSPRRVVRAAGTLLMAAALLVVLLWSTSASRAGQAGNLRSQMLAESATDIIRVAATGEDTPGCGVVASPCCTVQFAVDQAEEGDEIRVAGGLYTGVHARDGITQLVYISKTVTVRGGYTTGDWEDPDFAANSTTLDAQGLGRVVVISGTISPTIEGLHITGGDATDLGGAPAPVEPLAAAVPMAIGGRPAADSGAQASQEADAGAGVYIYGASPAISGCVIFSNTASTNAWAYCRGGGLYLQSSDGVLESNTIRGNAGCTDGIGDGGGLYLRESDATLRRNRIEFNAATTNKPRGECGGGGAYLWFSDALLEDNAVVGNIANSAYSGYGGGLCLHHSDATLRRNTVASNTAGTANYGYGGGMYLRYSAALLEGNVVQGNTASTGRAGKGGGLYADQSAARFLGNTVKGNTASAASDGYGGGLFLTGSPVELVGNAVFSNTASTASVGFGGGLCIRYEDALLRQNTILGNAASTSGDGYGGGLYMERTDSVLERNAVVRNTATLSPTAVAEGAGLWWLRANDFSMVNNLVADNQGEAVGSGLLVAGSSPAYPIAGRLVHNTIAHSGAAGFAAARDGGQGICVGDHATLAFTNTIIAGHSGAAIRVASGSTAMLEATLWYGNGSSAEGDGAIFSGTVNFYGDPAFVDPAALDYHLGPGSAAIDVGLDAGVRTDIDGDPRPHGVGFDIGVDEFNEPPVAEAGDDGTVDTLTLVTLDGSGSSDPEGDYPLSYLWTQLGGLTVTLSGATEVTSTFIAPDDPTVLVFSLGVTDSLGLACLSPGVVAITVTNQPPIPNAGADRTVGTHWALRLDGSASSDPDGDYPLTCRWTQSGGPTVTLTHPAAVTPTFTAPGEPTVLTFSLVVTDSLGLPALAPDDVVLVVQYPVYLPLVLRL